MRDERTNEETFGDFLKPYAGKYVASVSLAIAGVFFGLVPYYIAYRLLIGFPAGYSYRELLVGTVLILVFFVLQLLTHNASTAISHKTAFRILEQVRGALIDKMLRLPLGELQAKGSGHFHHMLIDGTERLEYPLAPRHSGNDIQRFAAARDRFSVVCSRLAYGVIGAASRRVDATGLSAHVYRYHERVC